jgi:hypothetical protein
MTLENEQKIREHLQQLKQFYTNLVTYGAIFLSTILIWMITGGPFWPIWVLFGLGTASVMQAIRIGLLPIFENIFPFLRADWEEEQLQQMMDREERRPPVRSKKTTKDE